jgi:hypothetical protein
MKCQWEGCNVEATPRSKYCKIHQRQHRTQYQMIWNKRKMVITQEPKSARHSKITWAMWEAFQDLTSDELQVLFKKRKKDIEYLMKYAKKIRVKQPDGTTKWQYPPEVTTQVREWRTEMAVIRDMYRRRKGIEIEREGWKYIYGEDEGI